VAGMILPFSKGTKLERDAAVGEGYFELKRLAEAGIDVEIVEVGKKLIKTNDKRVFIFQKANQANLMTIRGNVGKEIDRRMKAEVFEDFKVSFAMATKPSDEQRGYYWSVVLPTIQEHFKKQGNFMKEMDLHDAIKNCIEEEEGLTTEKLNPITGEVYQSKITISNAGNKKDTAKYIDAVIRWSSSYGIDIPECDFTTKLEKN
jgi:hypothetical protein